MASAPSAPIQWIPEDDLLLKNALEAGASLEALAKGAVQFSRRFSFQELRDRWSALLYDQDTSDQASTRMFELEISGINPSSKFNRLESIVKGNKEVPAKRKAETIRRKYYAMRKKFRTELFNNSELGFFEPSPHEFSGHGADYQKGVTLDGNTLGQNCMLGDSISDHLGLQEEDLDILRHAFPDTMRDIEVPSSTTIAPQTGCANSFEDNCPSGIIRNNKALHAITNSSMNENLQGIGFEDIQQFTSQNSEGFTASQTVMFASDQPQLRHWRTMQDVPDVPVPVGVSLGDSAVVPDLVGRENNSMTYTGEFTDPDSLLNLSNEVDILLIDLDDKNAEDKSCIDNIDSASRDSLKEVQENDVVKIEVETVAVLETNSVHASSSDVAMLEASASSIQEEWQIDLPPEVNTPSKSSSNNDIVELTDGQIICTLNTEDTEIPCNDDIFLLIHPSTSFGSAAAHPNTTVSMDTSTTAHEKNSQQAVNPQTLINDSLRPSVWPKPGMQGLPESHSGRSLVGHATKTEAYEFRSEPVFPEIVNKTVGDSIKGKSLSVITKLSNDILIGKDTTGPSTRVKDSAVINTETVQPAELDPGRIVPPEPVSNSSVSDEDESTFDDDIPYFSDIEAMILEMDLEPYDQDHGVIRQVPSYQYDETKKTIIRLEQAARSCLERAMTSQGALAILYGRHLRHYIKKPEVLLGRSTDDVDVDIDLRKEGRANKISRRQATIKMEADGSFSLKNLGKSSVSVNGVTVATGQLLALSSNCLIEVRGMSFVFEINQGYVKKHLANLFPKNKGKTGKSIRLPNDKQ